MYFYFFYFTGFSFECFALKAFFHHCLYWLYNRHLHNTTTQCRNFHSSFLHNLSLYAETGGRKYYSSDQLTDSIYWNLGYIMIIDNSVLCFINNFKEKNWSTAYLLLYIFFFVASSYWSFVFCEPWLFFSYSNLLSQCGPFLVK